MEDSYSVFDLIGGLYEDRQWYGSFLHDVETQDSVLICINCFVFDS